jgi:very-short-patch-repair endonuclease
MVRAMSTVDPLIVRIAERRMQLVTDDELERLGLPDRTIRHRIATGSLHRVAPGVLSTSPGPYDASQRELALCLSIDTAVLSHASAAAIWGIRRVPKGNIDITVPKGTRVPKCGAVIHYTTRMPEHHVVDMVDGSRVASVARTVFDLGGVLSELAHLSVIEDVRNKRLCTDTELGEVYDDLCGRGRRGSAAWQRLVHLVDRAQRPTMSELELELQEALIAVGLPAAVQQHPVRLPNGRTVLLDLAYPSHRVDIEVDHSEWHATLTAVAQDKVRDRGLAMLGWQPLRFTDLDITRNLRMCVATVRTVLDLRAPATPPSAA